MFSITQGKGFTITFANGWTASVQWGAGNYCDNYDLPISSTFLRGDDVRSPDAEIAAFSGDTWLRVSGKRYAPMSKRSPYGGTDVSGHIHPDRIPAFLAAVARQRPVT